MTAPTWMEDAPCRETDADIFHPDGRAPDYRPALRVCARCPFTTRCLDYALRLETADGTRSGVWGGTTPSQRSAISATSRVHPQQVERARRDDIVASRARGGASDPQIAAELRVSVETVQRSRNRTGTPAALAPRGRRPA